MRVKRNPHQPPPSARKLATSERAASVSTWHVRPRPGAGGAQGARARTLSLAEDVINVDGGAVAHGHPIVATGAVLTVRLLHAMRRGQARRGVVTLCIGGGQGIALALEAIG